MTTTGRPPTVSVMMPVYNAGRYLEQAVESVLAQTFGDFELLALDDGSTDGSLAILRRFAASDPRVRVASRPNAGVGRTRNEILAMAGGEFVAAMDADDVAPPGRFAAQVEYLRAHPEVVLVGGASQFIDESGRYLWAEVFPPEDEEIQAVALQGKCPIANSSTMFRREPVVALGGYREELAPAEDFDLFLRLGERGKLANLPQTLLYYRFHDDSISAVQQARQLEALRIASDEACDRRGIPRRYVPAPPWRPVDRASKHRYSVIFGWTGFGRGDRPTAVHYGLKAVRLMPWRADGWRLLACALLKRPRPGGATP